MVTLYFLCGVQGSGKTTFANTHKDEFKAKIVCTDEIRNMNPNLPENFVFPHAYKLTADLLNKGQNVILDVTNATKEARKHNLDCIKAMAQVEFKTVCYHIYADRDICVERVKKRNEMPGERYLPLEVIDQYIAKFDQPTLEEGYDELIEVKNC